MAKLLPENEFRHFLTYKNVRTQLFAAPEGWDSETIGTFKRDEKYGGLIRTLSLPISFVLDGYGLVANAFYADGYEAEVLYECEKLDKATFSYYTLFKSDLDFSQFEDDGISAKVMLLESGVSAAIKAKESVKFEHPLTGSDVVNIIIPGVNFSEKADFIFLNEGGSDRFMPAIDLVNNDTNSGFVTVQNVEQQENITDESIFATSDNWFIRSNRTNLIPINIKGFINGIYSKGGSTGNDFAILIKDENNTTIRTIYQSPSVTGGPFNFNVSFDFVHNLIAGQRLFFYVRTDVMPSSLKASIEEGDLTISYNQVSDPSNCKGIKMMDLFRRIMRRIAPQQQVDSFLLKNQWNNLIVTCGNAIRELDNAAIQTTLSDFFDTCNAIESAGMGFDMGVLKIEQRPFFFRPLKIDTLTGIKECVFSVAIDMVFNSVLTGYDDGNTDDTDGQFEYNSGQEWSLPIDRIQRKEDYKSKYRADQYGIEKLRVGFVKKTDDTSSDNDVFIFDCYLDGADYRPILGSSYIFVTGMSSLQAASGAYNLRLTPKKNLLRHESYLKSILTWYKSRYIEFASAEKNKNLVTVSNGQGIAPNIRVAESESISVASLNGEYFKPVIATLQTKLPKGFINKIDATPFGFIEFDFNDLVYRGYILESSIDLAKNAEREIKLLLTDAPTATVPPPVVVPPVVVNNLFCSNQQDIDIDVNTQVKENGNVIFDGFVDENEYKSVTVGSVISVEVYSIDEGLPFSYINILVNKNGVQIHSDSTQCVPGASLSYSFMVEQGDLYEVYGFPTIDL